MSLNFEAAAHTILNEIPYEAAFGALTAYGIITKSTRGRPFRSFDSHYNQQSAIIT